MCSYKSIVDYVPLSVLISPIIFPSIFSLVLNSSVRAWIRFNSRHTFFVIIIQNNRKHSLFVLFSPVDSFNNNRHQFHSLFVLYKECFCFCFCLMMMATINNVMKRPTFYAYPFNTLHIFQRSSKLASLAGGARAACYLWQL